ncbi:MAG: YhdP family protein, partial [Betaproteobacteria bacterium]
MPATLSTPSRAKRALRFVVASSVLLLGAFFALLLVLRVVVFPQIEARRDEVAQWIGGRIGRAVEIDNLVTGWDGWNPKLSVQGFRVRARDGERGVLLELPHVDLLVAWTSLPAMQLRLKELLIDGPRLAVRRDKAGRLHLAGIERDTATADEYGAVADWLLKQPLIIVRDALVAWSDEYRDAPQLLLDHVAFRLEQRSGRHRAALTGVPPADLAAPLELKADLTGPSLRDWTQLKGRLYLRLDYADVAAWREWLPLAVPVDSGKGAVRVWVDVAGSQPDAVTADLELEDVRATLGEGLAPLRLAHVGGRAGQIDLSAERFSLTLADGTELSPTDFKLTLGPGSDGTPGGTLTFAHADVRPLAAVASHLPLSARVRAELARYDPRGALGDATLTWTGDERALAHYGVKLQFSNVAVASRDGMPGALNLSGSIDANEEAGRVRIDSHAASVTLPKLFAEPLAFDDLRGDVTWHHGEDAVLLAFSDVAFANGDGAGTAAGSWRSRAGGAGDLDLKAQLTRANLASTYRYIPLGAGSGVRDWLRRALVKGTSLDSKLTIIGDLARFPFAAGAGGQFLFAARVQDAALNYSENWPSISEIGGDVRIEGTHLLVSATGGRVLGARLGATRAEIADLHDARPVLEIEGVASGPTQEFLAFVAQSPVQGWTGQVTQGASVQGDGALALKFELPLRDVGSVKVAGEYRFDANAVNLPHVPPLTDVRGALVFTEHDVRATDVTAKSLGGTAKLQVISELGRTIVRGSGSADLQQVRAQFDLPFFERIAGTANWQLALDSAEKKLGWTLDSTLEGASIDLPSPLGKSAAEKVALHVERREARGRDERIAIDYGPGVRVLLNRPLTGSASVDRVLVLLGSDARGTAEPEQPGIWVRGSVSALNLDDWLAVGPHGDAAGAQSGAASLALNGVDLNAASLDVLGRTFANLHASARRQGADWRLALDGRELAGSAVWHAATSAQPNGRFVARFARLTTPPAAGASVGDSAPAPEEPGATNRWPEVDIVADTFGSKERALGKLEFRAHPAGSDWQIQKLSLSNEAGRIDADGSWRHATTRSQTMLNVAVDVRDAGEFIAHFGWPSGVRAAPTKIDGQLSWNGAPSDFDYPTLTGNFKLRAGAGQFTKVDPGVGRLLGVLSLQALPRRISLDFRDVFSEGFAFDTVTADVRMRNGVMHTDDFRLVGPAAAVNIAGDVDVARETQQLKVRVQPSLSSGVSAGAAALFIANPLVGA